MTKESPKKKVSINSLFMKNASPKPPAVKKGSMQDILRTSLLNKFKIEKAKIDYPDHHIAFPIATDILEKHVSRNFNSLIDEHKVQN